MHYRALTQVTRSYLRYFVLFYHCHHSFSYVFLVVYVHSYGKQSAEGTALATCVMTSDSQLSVVHTAMDQEVNRAPLLYGRASVVIIS